MAQGYPTVDTATYRTTYDYTYATIDRRDVSEILDLFALQETPFLNRISWGPDCGASKCEWIEENLGLGYLVAGGAIASGASAGASIQIVVTSGTFGQTDGEIVKQLTTGSLLYGYNTTSDEHRYWVVHAIAADGSSVGAKILATAYIGGLASGSNVYLVGNFVNEGSEPAADKSRSRSVLSNGMNILRHDIQITGSDLVAPKHAVADELRHQITMRGVELKRGIEKAALLSMAKTGSSTVAPHMNGLYGFLSGQTGSHIDATTTTITENALGTICEELYQNGSNPDIFMGHPAIIRRFTSFNNPRVRTTVDEGLGGHHVTKYLTDTGYELDLVHLRRCPKNLAFVVDSSKIFMRARSGRKMLLQKLGIKGDYEQWQLLSEFTMEVRGYTLGQHGMFSNLEG